MSWDWISLSFMQILIQWHGSSNSSPFSYNSLASCYNPTCYSISSPPYSMLPNATQVIQHWGRSLKKLQVLWENPECWALSLTETHVRQIPGFRVITPYHYPSLSATRVFKWAMMILWYQVEEWKPQTKRNMIIPLRWKKEGTKYLQMSFTNALWSKGTFDYKMTIFCMNERFHGVDCIYNIYLIHSWLNRDFHEKIFLNYAEEVASFCRGVRGHAPQEEKYSQTPHLIAFVGVISVLHQQSVISCSAVWWLNHMVASSPNENFYSWTLHLV